MLDPTMILAAGGGGGLTDVDGAMVLWTWITFGIVLAVLSKFAWKPILNALDERESHIRQADENATKIKQELREVHAQREKIIAGADAKAKDIIAAARDGAVDEAETIRNKARDEAKILEENATREINAARDRAQAVLRADTAELAVKLAGMLVGENLDDQKNQVLVDRLIKEL